MVPNREDISRMLVAKHVEEMRSRVSIVDSLTHQGNGQGGLTGEELQACIINLAEISRSCEALAGACRRGRETLPISHPQEKMTVDDINKKARPIFA